MPFGKATSSLYPPAPGRFALIDNLRLFMTAEVLVLKYSTHDVTGIDGRYEIKGIPAGKATVAAFLPLTGESSQKNVDIKAGETLAVDFALPFTAQKFREQIDKVEQTRPSLRPPTPSTRV